MVAFVQRSVTMIQFIHRNEVLHNREEKRANSLFDLWEILPQWQLIRLKIWLLLVTLTSEIPNLSTLSIKHHHKWIKFSLISYPSSSVSLPHLSALKLDSPKSSISPHNTFTLLVNSSSSNFLTSIQHHSLPRWQVQARYHPLLR